MKKRKWIWIAVIIVVIAAVFVVNSPKNRAAIFAKLNHERIEEGLSLNAGVPADDALLFGYRSVNTWEGEHPMTEFIIMTRGDTYYGVYYSPDDVPVAFQNVPVKLTQVAVHKADYEKTRNLEEQKNKGRSSLAVGKGYTPVVS